MDEYTNKLKWVATVILLVSSFCYALLSSSFGSTLIDFKEITNTTMDKMSFSLTFRFLGCCIGAAFGFGIPEKTNTTVLYSFLLTTLGTLSIVIGQLTQLWSVFLVQFLMGLASGAIDVGVAAQIFQLWRDEGGPFMQALALGWNVAGVCSPLIFEPFLSPTRPNGQHLNSTNIHNETSTLTPLSETFNATFEARKSVVGANSNESRIWIPLSIIGLMLITSGLMVLSTPVYVYLKSKKLEISKKSEINSEKTTTNDSKPQTENSEKEVKEIHWKRYKVYLLTLCSILFFIYYAIGDTVMQFWLTFVVNCDLKLTKSQASFMLSALNAAYSVSGLIGIFVTAKVKPYKMILTLIMMIAVGNIIHVFFANTSLAMLWIGALIEYAGFGCFYASVFNYMQSKVGLTTRMCSMLVLWSYLASGVGYTAVIGNYLETRPIILIYNNIGCTVILVLLLFAIYKLDTINKRKNKEHKIKLSFKKPSINSTTTENIY